MLAGASLVFLLVGLVFWYLVAKQPTPPPSSNTPTQVLEQYYQELEQLPLASDRSAFEQAVLDLRVPLEYRDSHLVFVQIVLDNTASTEQLVQAKDTLIAAVAQDPYFQ